MKEGKKEAESRITYDDPDWVFLALWYATLELNFLNQMGSV